MNQPLQTSFSSRSKVARPGAWLASVALAGLLAACGSNVKLDDVPVSDRTGAPVQPLTQEPVGNNAQTQQVPSVVMDERAMAEPPASVARIIYFDYDSFQVKPEFAATLDAHAKFLKADPKRRVVLQGHTDERGGREYNLALGQKRSEAVRRALGVLGVSDAQMEAVSFGEEKPAATGLDEAAFAKNRRVELAYR